MGGLPPGPPPPAPPSGGVGSIDILAKRAEIQAKLAAMRKMAPGGAGAAPSPPPSLSAPPPPPSNLPPVPGLPRPNLDPDLAKKVAEAKRLVESMQAKKRAAAMPANPYLVSSAVARGLYCPAYRRQLWSQSTPVPKKNDPVLDPAVAGRGGLAMAAHPLLMDNSAPAVQTKKDRYRPMVPKFSTTKVCGYLPMAVWNED